jgi:DHA1 family multidrug resistance protein-like MFS transporter
MRKERVHVLYWPMLLGTAGLAFLGFALPVYGKDLGASALQIGGLFSSFALIATLFRPGIGWALDRFGRKWFFVVALLCYALAMWIFAEARTVSLLYAGQIVRGFGASMLWISAYTIATDLIGGQGRGKAVGRVDEATARGQLFGGLAGFVLISLIPTKWGWQILFTGYAILAAVGAYLAWRNVPETRVHRTDGSVPSLKRVAISPFLLKLMSVVFVTAAVSAMTAPIFLVFLQDRLTRDLGLLVLAIIPAGLIASYFPSRLGALSDRFGRTRLMALGLITSGIVSLALPLLHSLWFLAGLWASESFGWAVAGPAEESLVADITERQARGSGYGLYTFASGLGRIVGPISGGWLYDSMGQATPFFLGGIVLLLGALFVVAFLSPGPSILTESD